MAHAGLEREKGGGHGVLPAGGTHYTDPSSPSALPPASSSAWSPYLTVLDGRKARWGMSGTGKGNPVRRGGGGKEARQWSPYRTASRGSGGQRAGSGRRPSPTSRVAFPPSRKGVQGSGAQWEEEDGAVSLPTLLVSRRSYQKALQVAAAAGGGGSGSKSGGTTKKRLGGSRQGSSRSAGSRGAPPTASAPSSKELEGYPGKKDTLPTFPPGYGMELEERVHILDRQLGEARLALQDALVTVEHLRRENDTLRVLQQRIAQGGGDALLKESAALPTREMADQESSSSGGPSLEGGERKRSLLPPSMDLARLTAENSLLEEQKRLLGEEVRRLQAAQQQSWETSQQQLSTLTTQLHQFHHSASTNADALHTAEAKWGQEKEQLERECHALKIRLNQTEAELTACRAGGGMLSSSSHATAPSSIPLPGLFSAAAADGGGLGLLAGSSPSAPPPLPAGGSSGSSSSPSSGSEGGGLDVAVLQEMRRHQAEETKSILQHERSRWEEERTTLRRELSDAQRALLQGTQEKYALRFYTDRVQQLEGELSQKSSEVGQMEQQLLHALGALQSCQRDATEAVRQEVGQELAQLRQDVEEAHAARREKEKRMMEQREQLAEANRKAQQWSADVAMYKEMIEKYYAGVLDGLPSGSLQGAATQGGGQAPTSPLHSTHRGSSSSSSRLPSGGRLPQGMDFTKGEEEDGQHHRHPPVSALPPFPHTNTKTPSGLSSEELHRAYAVAALQKSSAKYTSLWSDAANLSPSLRVGSDGKPLALSAEAKAPLQLFEALQWDEKWEAKQLREALATAALDVELAVQQSQQERTQAEHYREQLANMTKERDVLLDENIEMRRRLRHVQTVFAKQQMHAYRSSLTQRRGGGGSVVSVGMAYAEGEQRNENGGGNGPLPTAFTESQREEGKAWTASSAAMAAASRGQVDILLRSVYLDDAVLPLLQLLASPPQRHHPTSLFFTLDGLLGYGTMLSPSFYSVEEGLSDVLFQYGGLSPDTLTVDEIQRTTLVLQLHRALRGDTSRKGERSHKKGHLKGVGKRTPLLEKKNTDERAQRADEAIESEEDDDDDDPSTMTMMEEGGIEGGSEIIAQAELPGAWLLQASEMAQEATLDLISGRGDVVGHVMMEFSCHQLMLPITLGLPLTRDVVSHDGEDGKQKLGVDNGMVLSASEVKAALVALRSVIAIRIQVFRLDGITARVPVKKTSAGGEADAAVSSSLEQKKKAEGQEEAALPGGLAGGMREVSPYVFYTTNSVLPSVSAIRDTVVRPTALHRHRAEEEEEEKEDASTSGPLLSASFESTPTEHRVAVDQDLIHFLCYSSVAFVVFDEHEADVSQQLGMAEIPLRSLLDSPQAFIREETVLHPRGKLTVGLSWRSL